MKNLYREVKHLHIYNLCSLYIKILYILRLCFIFYFKEQKKYEITTNDSQEMGSHRFKSWLKLLKKKSQPPQIFNSFNGEMREGF